MHLKSLRGIFYYIYPNPKTSWFNTAADVGHPLPDIFFSFHFSVYVCLVASPPLAWLLSIYKPSSSPLPSSFYIEFFSNLFEFTELKEMAEVVDACFSRLREKVGAGNLFFIKPQKQQQIQGGGAANKLTPPSPSFKSTPKIREETSLSESTMCLLLDRFVPC